MREHLTNPFELDLEEQLKRDKELKKQWLDENSKFAIVLKNNKADFKKDFGFFMTVKGLEIYENMFKEEFDSIFKAYGSVMKKMEDHYNANKK